MYGLHNCQSHGNPRSHACQSVIEQSIIGQDARRAASWNRLATPIPPTSIGLGPGRILAHLILIPCKGQEVAAERGTVDATFGQLAIFLGPRNPALSAPPRTNFSLTKTRLHLRPSTSSDVSNSQQKHKLCTIRQYSGRRESRRLVVLLA